MRRYEKAMDIAKRRGFVWPSFEIYGGVSGFYDLGPLGTLLKNKIIQKWRERYVLREGFVEIDSPSVLPEEVLRASGHVDHFVDAMSECQRCKAAFRIADVVREATGKDVEGMPKDELKRFIDEHGVRCPDCGGEFGPIFDFNAMFRTTIGPGTQRVGYLRPETAQTIFIDFKRLQRYARGKLPFGVVQIGRGYRNEISPRQGLIRLREFTMAEAEVFFDPEDPRHPNFREVEDEKLRLWLASDQERGVERLTEVTAGEALEKKLVCNELMAYHLAVAKLFLLSLGIPADAIRFRQQTPGQRAHYSSETWDAEVSTEQFGWVEVAGLAYRTNYDLSRHSSFSGADLTIFVTYDEPRMVERATMQPNLEKLRSTFKKDAKRVAELLAQADPAEVKRALDLRGRFDLQGFGITAEHVAIRTEKVEETGRKVLCHVVEPSYGIERPLYCVLEHALRSEKDRTYLALERDLAPIEVCIFPLISRDGLPEKAREVQRMLMDEGLMAEYDEAGSIGRRYARADEAGTPYCVTIDHQTSQDNTVTIRDRDTTKQVRVKIADLPALLRKLIAGKISLEEAGEAVERA